MLRKSKDQGNRDSFNPDYALGFVMRTVSAIKSGCLETEA
jgi:hypothetical protein